MPLSRRHFIGACGATLVATRTAIAAPSPEQTPVEPLRVALVCDTHTNLETEGDMALFRPRFDAVIEAVNACNVALVLLGGDLTEGGKAPVVEAFRAQAAKIKAPQLWVAGNHDVGAKKAEGVVSNLSQARVLAFEALMGSSFWAREIGGARFIGVNASLFGSGLEREAAQWEWLETTLAASVEAPLGTHLLTHYPPFLKSPDEPSDPYWNIEPEPRARLLALLQKADVRGVFSGHLHRPLFNQTENLTLITAPPVSFGLPRGEQPQGWTLLSIAPGGEISYQTREITI